MKQLRGAFIFYLILVGSNCNRAHQQSVVQAHQLQTRGEISFSKRLDVGERMSNYQVPGVSIAVIKNYEIEWAKGYGVTAAGTSALVNRSTVFQSGSIGKSIVAAAALHFVELGELDLDEDVNLELNSWKVPVNSFTERRPVTMRGLLSHTAGATLPGVIGYAQVQPIPSLVQILNGDPPANTPPVHIDRVPGTAYRYSGGGYLIIQQLLFDLFNSERSFPSIIENIVFDPLDMRSSTFDFAPDQEIYEVAKGHRSNGLPVSGSWFNYPEMGMGVFWTTPSDMAQFVIEIMLAYQGQSNKIISEKMVQVMLSPVMDNYGLGLNLGDDGKDRFYFYHRGATEGYQTYMVGYPKRGQGAIIMTNSDNGYDLIQEILKNLSLTYRWLRGFYL